MNAVKLLVIGGGAAGMATALGAREAGLADLLLTERGDTLGGVLPQCLHEGFGRARFGRDMTGAAYGARYRRQVEAASIPVLLRTAVLSLGPDRSALLTGPDGVARISFSRCVLATGCRETPANALGLAGTRPAGVFTAGEAQRMINLSRYDIGDRFVILGSGDIGQIVARDLAMRGKEIAAMVERRNQLGGLMRNRRECVEKYRIPVLFQATVDEILGTERVCAVMVRHADGRRQKIPCDALITAVGLIPERELATPLMGADGTLPDWLSLCGNCDFVHDRADGLSLEGEALGRRLGTELQKEPNRPR